MKSHTRLVLNKLQSVKPSGKGWVAKCPAHEDKEPSLSIGEGVDGRVLLNCHAGCDPETILQKMGLTWEQVFPEATTDARVVIAEYPYTDEDGKVLFVKERLFPKSFRQRTPDGKWSLEGVRRVLYRLPRVVEGIRLGRRIWLVAGERDVHTMEALGEVATTSPDGEGANWRPEFTTALAGADVRIIADRDEPGRVYATRVGTLLAEAGIKVQTWEAAQGKDVTDHVRAGLGIGDLVVSGSSAPVLTVVEGGRSDFSEDMVRCGDAVVWEGSIPDLGDIQIEATEIRRQSTGIHARVKIKHGHGEGGPTIAYDVINIDKATQRKDLAAAAARKLGYNERGVGPETAKMLLRLDNFGERMWACWLGGEEAEWISGDDSQAAWLLEPWIVDGGGTILFGDPKAGKSNIALMWALNVTHGKGPWPAIRQTPALYVNLERSEVSLKRRVKRLAAAIGTPERLLTLNRRGQRLEDVRDALTSNVRRHKVGLVILDSLSRAGTGNLNDNEPANKAMDILNGTGCSWLAIGHTGHENKTRLFGSQMFGAAADLQVRLTSARETDPADDEPYSLGILLEARDANDVRPHRPQTWALEFGPGNVGVAGFRRGSEGEFTDLEPLKRTTRQAVVAHLVAVGAATASSIAEETGLDRSRVGHVLRSDEFIVVGKEAASKGGRPAAMYAVRSGEIEPL